jgi:transcription antitermination factor NusG
MAEACPPSSAAAPSWFALRLRSNQDFKVAETLGRRGFICFLPFYKETNRWSDRIKVIHRPFFPGYLFIQTEQTRFAEVVATQGVVQILPSSLNPSEIPDREIRNLRTALDSRLTVSPHPYVIGSKVILDSGPLAGCEGIVVRTKGSTKLVVSIEILQRSCAVEIDHASLKAA